jgi:hypothetical protein
MWWWVGAALAVEPSAERRVEGVVRGGAATYAPFTFWTVGGEARVRVVSGLRVVAGAEAWGTNRIPPPDYQFDEGVYSVWSWMQPIHAGALFQLTTGPIEPYAGAEALVVNHTKGALSVGGRARVGADFFFAGPVGVGLDLSAGAWSGKGWTKLADGASDTGLVAQGTTQLLVGF